jgi:hypothetical protein
MKSLIFFIIAAISLRLLPHYPNFAPVTAIALFSGAYFNRRVAFLLPILIMVVSDYLLLYISPYGTNFSQIHPLTALFHSTTPFVWGSFLISSALGVWIGRKKTAGRVGFAAVAASIQFFLLTNLGVWLTSGMYSLDLNGLLNCFVMAIPFYKGTLLGDIFYSGLFFGGFELVRAASRKYSFLKS